MALRGHSVAGETAERFADWFAFRSELSPPFSRRLEPADRFAFWSGLSPCRLGRAGRGTARVDHGTVCVQRNTLQPQTMPGRSP
jgi:hypothetical protein